jgi:hypothetical protein
VIALAEDGRFALAEWQADLAFRPGAKVGPFELSTGFNATLRGVNKFKFDGEGLIKCLRIYHETSTVSQLAQQHAKKD